MICVEVHIQRDRKVSEQLEQRVERVTKLLKRKDLKLTILLVNKQSKCATVRILRAQIM